MRRENCKKRTEKRAVCAGLFLGILCSLTGCVKPTVHPVVTKVPQPVPTGTATLPVTATPEITKRGENVTEIPTSQPEAIITRPVPPTMEPKPSLTPEAEISSVPTSQPSPTSTMKPNPTVISPEMTPEVSPTPEALPTASPLPLPTGSPDYKALLQNGWQRTEDFFGNRGIYFSGRFCETEVIREQGSYGYCYTSPEEPEVTFSVIGEEAAVQLFLDELIRPDVSCDILQEGAEDYSYTYVADDIRVTGRVYACYVTEQAYRMRVELRCPATWDTQKEGYDFYLQ